MRNEARIEKNFKCLFSLNWPWKKKLRFLFPLGLLKRNSKVQNRLLPHEESCIIIIVALRFVIIFQRPHELRTDSDEHNFLKLFFNFQMEKYQDHILKGHFHPTLQTSNLLYNKHYQTGLSFTYLHHRIVSMDSITKAHIVNGSVTFNPPSTWVTITVVVLYTSL